MDHLMTRAIAMAFAVAALFFFRFWRRTGDRLFAFFALSFVNLSMNRFALSIAQLNGWKTDYLYWIRFAALP